MILTYCTSACRTLVFLFVVFLVGYIMVKNERKIENFVDRIAGAPVQSDEISQAQQETIRSAMRNYLNRDPQPEDFEKYSKLMANPNDILSVVDAIKATDEYKALVASSSQKNGTVSGNDILLEASELQSSPLLEDLKKADFDTRMDTYRKVIDVYMRVLERMPSNKELTYYAHRMLTDKQFSSDKLRVVLEGSNEYKILEKNQINRVNGELPGAITDAQLTMDVTNKYQAIYNREPSPETVSFLKDKYIAYKLDEGKFNSLLLAIHNLDYNNFVTSEDTVYLKLPTTKAAAENLARNPNAAPPSFSTSSTDQTLDSSFGTQNTQGKEINNINIYVSKPEDLDAIVSQFSKASDSLVKVQQTPQTKNLHSQTTLTTPTKRQKDYTDPFYKALAQSQKEKPSCTFNDDVPIDTDTFAEYRSQRNHDEINYTCTRNQYYKDIDPDIVATAFNRSKKKDAKQYDVQPLVYSYEPENSTPLDAARQTHVGSILPPFIYKEAVSTP